MATAARELPILGFFLAAAAYATWPIALHLGTGVTGSLTDPLENAWVFAWEAHALLHQPLHLFSGNIFYPQRLTLAYTENLLGLSVFLAPIYWITHNVLLEVNVATILVYALTGFTTYLLVRELGGQRAPAVVAGLLFSFGPFRLALVQHIVELAIYLLPVALLILVRLSRVVSGAEADGPAAGHPASAGATEGESPKGALAMRLRRLSQPWRQSLALALVVGWQIWTSITGGVMMLTAIGVWFAWHLLLRRSRAAKVLVPAAAGVALGVVLAVPVLIPYALLHQLHPEFRHSLAEVLQYSSVPVYYLSPSILAGAPFIKSLLRSQLLYFRKSGLQAGVVKVGLFPGFTLTAAFAASLVSLAVLGVRGRLRGRRLPSWAASVGLFAAIAAAGFVMTLGPRLGRVRSGLPLPFAAVSALVPAGGIRVPLRFMELILFGAAVSAGLAISALRPALRRWLVVVVLLGFALETMPTTFQLVKAPPLTAVHRMVAQTKGAVLGLPATDINIYGFPSYKTVDGQIELPDLVQMYLSTSNFRPIVNGNGSLLPPFYLAQMTQIQDFPSASSMAVVKRWGVGTILVQLKLLAGTHWSDAVSRLDAWPGIRLVGANSEVRVYDISGVP